MARRVARRFENPDASVTEHVVVAIDHLRFRSSAGGETVRSDAERRRCRLCPGDLVFVEDPCRRMKRIGVAGVVEMQTREREKSDFRWRDVDGLQLVDETLRNADRKSTRLNSSHT